MKIQRTQLVTNSVFRMRPDGTTYNDPSDSSCRVNCADLDALEKQLAAVASQRDRAIRLASELQTLPPHDDCTGVYANEVRRDRYTAMEALEKLQTEIKREIK